VTFAIDGFVILKASETTKVSGFRNGFEFTTTFAFDFQSKKIRQLLSRTEALFPAQAGLGRILGLNEDGEDAYYAGLYWQRL